MKFTKMQGQATTTCMSTVLRKKWLIPQKSR